MTLPNFITLGRIISVPVIVFLVITDQFAIAFVLFLAAGISDGVDGFLAKRFDMASRLGAYLDPLADKALLVSVYLALASKGILPVWLAVLIVSRDILIVGAVVLAWVMDQPIKVAPLMISKASTTAQIMLAAVALYATGFDRSFVPFLTLLTYLTAILTILSGLAYIRDWIEHMSSSDGNGEGRA